VTSSDIALTGVTAAIVAPARPVHSLVPSARDVERELQRSTVLARSRRAADPSGFSLIETLVAMTILAVGLTTLAQLFAMSVMTNASSRKTSVATLLAQQKVEQLRALTYGFDTLGLPLTDTGTDTTVEPEASTGGTGLSPSPDGTLASNVPGYCDFADAYGRLLPSATATAPVGTAYIRRWSIQPLPSNPNNTFVIQVLVTPRRDRGAADSADTPGGLRLPDEARMVTVKTRKAA